MEPHGRAPDPVDDRPVGGGGEDDGLALRVIGLVCAEGKQQILEAVEDAGESVQLGLGETAQVEGLLRAADARKHLVGLDQQRVVRGLIEDVAQQVHGRRGAPAQRCAQDAQGFAVAYGVDVERLLGMRRQVVRDKAAQRRHRLGLECGAALQQGQAAAVELLLRGGDDERVFAEIRSLGSVVGHVAVALLREARAIGAGIVPDLVQEELEAVLLHDVLPPLVEGGIELGRQALDEGFELGIEQVGMQDVAALERVLPQPVGVGCGGGAGHGCAEKLDERRIHSQKRDRGK